MELPVEMELNIISFAPEHQMGLICKAWQEEINAIRKNAVDTIGKWYRPRRSTNDYNTVTAFVRHLVINYPNEHFLLHPEFTVRKLGLNPKILTVLPPLPIRKRSNVRDWILNVPISFSDWIYVGI
jgi:hypothetical protein